VEEEKYGENENERRKNRKEKRKRTSRRDVTIQTNFDNLLE